ncbi:MAG: amidase domain-containing protein [Clostridiales bacterium]|nr:amidase domain-containing protein [Clostridiales bacterium]
MEPTLFPYQRQAAVAYAHRWAFDRNPAYLNFDPYGGDCTSFVSQCVYAGSGVMNNQETFGWYYRTANHRTPSWTGVPYFFNFMTRKERSPGPLAAVAAAGECLPGDCVQLSFDGERFAHTVIIVSVSHPARLETTLVAAHSDDADNRPLSMYPAQKLRFLHILGVIPG